MYRCLKKINFGNNFINWIKILYCDPKIVVKNNGYLSRQIKIEQGLRQGCPVSAILFILCIEILALNIDQNKNIKGFVFGDTELKISQYADDSTLLLKDFLSLEEALKTVSTFSDFAGPKLNLQKTEGLLLGPLKHSNIKSYNNIEFKDSPIKCLGIYIGHDKERWEESNWDSKIHKMESILKLWEKRNLTIFGKVTIVNTLCLPKVMYNCMLLVVPERVVVKIERMISHFIWHGKNRINRNCVTNSVENGGLNLVDVRLKIKSLKAG